MGGGGGGLFLKPDENDLLLPDVFDINFTWGLPLSFFSNVFGGASSPRDRNVPANDERALSTKGAQQVWKKSTKVLQSLHCVNL